MGWLAADHGSETRATREERFSSIIAETKSGPGPEAGPAWPTRCENPALKFPRHTQEHLAAVIFRKTCRLPGAVREIHQIQLHFHPLASG